MSEPDSETPSPESNQNFVIPNLTILVVFLILFSVLTVFLWESDETGKELQVIAPEIGNPVNPPAAKMPKAINAMTEEIYSEGELAPQTYDVAADTAAMSDLSDFNIVFNHKPTKEYLERVVVCLQSKSNGLWGQKRTDLKLYDDRFVGDKNNALSLPGGTIFASASLILSVRTEAELAGILSHERAHIVLRHAAQKRKFIRNAVFLEHRLAKDGEIEKIQILNLVKMKIFGSKEMDQPGELYVFCERQADSVGQRLLRGGGYDDTAFAVVLERVSILYHNQKSVLDFTRDRVKDILKESHNFKSETDYSGKDFIVSNAEELEKVQKNLKKHLENH